ncbi:glycosyltransferase [Rubellimicrobium roseum]|uniref:Glycosyltransferase n=1 Tax=Rubellimicrobium roseum TaxID=687525 RepID=A0A5C4N9V7_9RHOB|nr:glycosyltransferase [Rubellimicrobium roseum]TNC71393.1 glycosyltransferase [Rubellimicrobium roseum]
MNPTATEDLDRLHRGVIAPVPDGTERPLWSVMIPVYNAAHDLRRSLGSVLDQCPDPSVMQIEVVDDFSTKDDPGSVVQELGGGRAEFFRQPQNVGHSRNFNTCIARARGHLVHILHADDFVAPGFYDRLGAVFAVHPEAGAAFCRHAIVDPDGTPKWEWDIRTERETPGIIENWLDRIAARQLIQTPSIAVRREVYERLGGFDDRIRTCGEDWEMWVRIAAHYPVGYHPDLLAYYQDSSDSLTKRSIRSGQNIKDLRLASQLCRGYLPKPALAANRRSYEAWAELALHWAYEGFKKGHHAAALVQLREALICSRSTRILGKARGIGLFGLRQALRRRPT